MSHYLKKFIFILIATCTTFPAFATTYYVSPLGAPGLNGLSPANATTLAYAIQNLAQAGDKVLLLAGHYRQPNTIYIRKGITIMAVQPRSVLINGRQNSDAIFTIDLLNSAESVSLVGFQMSDGSIGVRMYNPGSLTLSNMTFNNHRNNGVDFNYIPAGNYKLLVKNCRFQDNQIGLMTIGDFSDNQSSIIVKNSVFRRNGIDIQGNVPDSLFAQQFLVEYSKFIASESSIVVGVRSSNNTFNQNIVIYNNQFEDIQAQAININTLSSNFQAPARSEILIKKNTILNGANAITILGQNDIVGPRVMIEANQIDMPSPIGITLQGAKANVINNIISNAGHTGIMVPFGAILAAFNTVVNSNVDGININMSSGVASDLYSNIVYNNMASGININYDPTMPLTNIGFNNSFGNAFDNYPLIPYNDMGGNLSTDPLFVNFPSDLHLTAASPLIDMGGGYTATEDFELKPRYMLGGPITTDIGALEFR